MVKVKMLRTAGDGFGCHLLEGDTGEVSQHVGEKVVAYGIAVHIPDPPKPPPPVEVKEPEPAKPEPVESKREPELLKAIPEEPAIAKANPPAVQSAKPQRIRKAPHQRKHSKR